VVFHLDDLKDIAEDTNGRIKYVAKHHVRGRMRILALADPFAWSDTSTYPKVKAIPLDPLSLGAGGNEEAGSTAGGDEEAARGLQTARAQLQEVLAIHGELKQADSMGNLAHSLRFRSVMRPPGFWEMCTMLATLQSLRLQLSVRRMHKEVNRLVQEWVREHPEGLEALKVDPAALPPEIRHRGAQAREATAEGSAALRATFQQILQTPGLQPRVVLLSDAVEQELLRLRAERSLKSVLDDIK